VQLSAKHILSSLLLDVGHAKMPPKHFSKSMKRSGIGLRRDRTKLGGSVMTLLHQTTLPNR
jgi:hypothetical protein